MLLRPRRPVKRSKSPGVVSSLDQEAAKKIDDSDGEQKLNTVQGEGSSQTQHMIPAEAEYGAGCQRAEKGALREKVLTNLLKYWVSFKPVFHWRVGVIIVSHITWAIAASIYIVLLPEHMKGSGLSPGDIANIIMIYGAVAIASKLIGIALGKTFPLY